MNFIKLCFQSFLLIVIIFSMAVLNFESEAIASDNKSLHQQSLADTIFTDDFADHNDVGWHRYHYSHWSVVWDAGDYAYFLNTTNYEPAQNELLGEYSYLPGYDLANFEFVCQAKTAENLSQNVFADYAIVYGWVDSQNYYCVLFSRMKGYTSISRLKNGVRHDLGTYNDFTFKDNEYHEVRVIQNGKYTIVFFDGEFILSANTPEYFHGYVGVGSCNDAAYFDDIIIKYPEPHAHVVQLEAPNGNEVWQVGTRYPINWKSDVWMGTVYIDISTTGGDTWWDITRGYGTPNDGQYSYEPTTENISAHCLFRVRLQGVDYASDESDDEFIIVGGLKNYIANHVPYGVSPPNVDGVLNDAAWNFASSPQYLHTGGVPGDYMVPWGNFTDNDVKWKAIWSSATNLVYVAVEVTDDIAGAVDNPFNELYKDDCVEIFVDGDHSGNIYYNDTVPAQHWFIRRDNTKNLGYTGNIAYTGSAINSAVYHAENGNWILELSMAIYDNYPSDIRPLDTNDLIGWDVWYDDSDNTVTDGGKWDRDHQVGWGYTGPAYYNANLFQELILGPAVSTPQDIAITPTSHDFGSIEVGSFGYQSFTVRNEGGADLFVSSVALSGTNASEFRNESDSFTLSPGESYNISVQFNPSSTGAKSAVLVVQSNDSDEAQVNINLTGTGISPGWNMPINISGNGQTYIRTIGGNAQATTGYDPAFDIVTTPPGMTYYVYLSLIDFPYYLQKDVRPWQLPYNAEITWTLQFVNNPNVASIITWDPTNLPSEGSFFLTDNNGFFVDMRNASSAVYDNGDALYIEYSKEYRYTYNFPQQGWYLVSLPVTTMNNSLNALFPGAFQAFKYNPTTRNYEPVTVLEPGVGYWLMIMSPCTATITGTPVRKIIRTYNTGWYLIGTVAGSADFSNPNDSPDGAVIAAYGYNTTTRQYFDVYPPGTGTLNEGNGYWIAVLAPCTLILGENDITPVIEQGNVMTLSAFHKVYGEQPPAPPTMTTNEQNTVHPVTQFLIRNYPNPFNPETTIEYQLPEAGFTNIYIYNSLGQKIKTLVNSYHESGTHTVQWNGTDYRNVNVANGIYFVKIIQGNESQTRKLLMLK